MFRQSKGPGKEMIPGQRIGMTKARDNEMGQNMKTRYNESIEDIIAEDRKKVQKKVSQMRQELPGGEVDVKLNQQDVLRINPFDPNLISSLNSNQ